MIFDWFVLGMRMQVILDSSFARSGSAPIWGGKKGEFRDWTNLEQNDVICKTFGIHLRGTPPEFVNITQALDTLRGVSSWLNSWERQTRESLGRTGAVQGPQGIASSKSISSVNIITNFMQSLKETV